MNSLPQAAIASGMVLLAFGCENRSPSPPEAASAAQSIQTTHNDNANAKEAGPVKLTKTKEQIAADDADLHGSTFHNVNLSGVTFDDINLEKARLNNVNLSGVEITDANIQGMTIDGVSVADAIAAYHKDK